MNLPNSDFNKYLWILLESGSIWFLSIKALKHVTDYKYVSGPIDFIGAVHVLTAEPCA